MPSDLSRYPPIKSSIKVTCQGDCQTLMGSHPLTGEWLYLWDPIPQSRELGLQTLSSSFHCHLTCVLTVLGVANVVWQCPSLCPAMSLADVYGCLHALRSPPPCHAFIHLFWYSEAKEDYRADRRLKCIIFSAETISWSPLLLLLRRHEIHRHLNLVTFKIWYWFSLNKKKNQD